VRPILCLPALLLAVAAGCGRTSPTAPTQLAITTQPQSQSVTLGSRATLTVAGRGGGAPLQYQWYVGPSGTEADPVTGATTASLTTPVMLSTTSYWVRITDGTASVDSATAVVTVVSPAGGAGPAPTITTEPEDDTIEPGQQARLDVGVTGAAPMSYQWYTGTSGTTTAPVAGATSDELLTPALTVTTRYWVRIWNGAGVVDSRTATITVSAAPASGNGAPVITSQPASRVVDPGATVTLDVVATGATPLHYQWFVGTRGDESSPVSGATADRFTTWPLGTTTDFWVRVWNGAGAADSETARITVSSSPPPPIGLAPTIVTPPQGQTVTSGQSVTLSVVATGSAPLGYQWYVGPSGSTSSSVAGAVAPNYTTPALTTTMTYWVRVSNAQGSVDSAAATIVVSSGTTSASFEDQVLVLVNQHRASGATCGGTPYAAVGPLAMDANLQSAARAHSQDMAANNYFSHTSLDGRTFDDRIRDAGYAGAFPWGENIAAGYSTPHAVVAGWMSSPGHCANIMNGSFRAVGVGYAYLAGSSYGHYWTQDFGGS